MILIFVKSFNVIKDKIDHCTHTNHNENCMTVMKRQTFEMYTVAITCMFSLLKSVFTLAYPNCFYEIGITMIN